MKLKKSSQKTESGDWEMSILVSFHTIWPWNMATPVLCFVVLESRYLITLFFCNLLIFFSGISVRPIHMMLMTWLNSMFQLVPEVIAMIATFAEWKRWENPLESFINAWTKCQKVMSRLTIENSPHQQGMIWSAKYLRSKFIVVL